MNSIARALTVPAAAGLVAGCATFPQSSGSSSPEQRSFWTSVRAHCGRRL